jgi:hypothetical protein
LCFQRFKCSGAQVDGAKARFGPAGRLRLAVYLCPFGGKVVHDEVHVAPSERDVFRGEFAADDHTSLDCIEHFAAPSDGIDDALLCVSQFNQLAAIVPAVGELDAYRLGARAATQLYPVLTVSVAMSLPTSVPLPN